MSYLRINHGGNTLKLLRVLQAAVIAIAIAAVVFNAYKFSVTGIALCRAEAKWKESNKTLSRLAEAPTSGWNAGALCAVEPPQEYTRFISTFIRQVTVLAKYSRCTLKSISPKQAQSAIRDGSETISYRPVEVGLEMSGDYAGIDAFIDGLSRLPKVTKIAQIELKRQAVDQKTRKIKLDAKMTLVLCMIEPLEKH